MDSQSGDSLGISGDVRDTNGEFPTRQTGNYQLLNTSKQPPNYYNKYVIGCALLASLNSVLLGYDIGIMSGAVLFIKEDLKIHELQEEVLVGSLNLISLVGGVAAGRLSDLIGRRKTMAIASVIFFIGAAVMGLAPTFGVLLFGRVVAGIGVGFGLMIAPVYTAEVAPSTTRGALVSFPEIFINVGILLGYIVSYLLSGLPAGLSWRLMLGAGCIPAVTLAFGVLVMPESPRWLVMQNRISEAEEVLIKTSGSKQEAVDRLVDILEAAGGDSRGVSGDNVKLNHTRTVKESKGEGVWGELLCPIPSVRRMLIVALGIQFFQQASGIDALVYYSPAVFNAAGITSKGGVLGATVAIGFTKTMFILVATFLMDRVGRKPLLLISSAGMTASLATVGLGFIFFNMKVSTTHRHIPVKKGDGEGSEVALSLIITAICTFMASFSVGFGPINMVLNSEVFPLRLRAQAVSFGLLVNRLVSGTIALTFLSISDALTLAGSFFMFGAIAFASIVFIWFFVPETKGKSLEEMAEVFEYGNADVESTRYGDVELVNGVRGQGDEVDEEHGDDVDGVREGVFYDDASHKKLLDKVKLIAMKH